MFRAIVLISLFTNSSADIKDCGKDRARFTISQLSQSPPNQIVSGDNINIILNYSSPVEILGGTATTTITYNSIPFPPFAEDLCTKVICPFVAGPHNGSITFPFPRGYAGTIMTKIVWKDLNGNLLLCINSALKAISLMIAPAVASAPAKVILV